LTNCHKVVKKLLKSCQKILKRVGGEEEEGGGGGGEEEEGDL
jgi:hypothetical protein